MTLARRSLGALLVTTLFACGGGEPAEEPAPAGEAPATEATEPMECAVASSALETDADVSGWVGEFDLAMLGADGRRVDGTMTLTEQAEDLRTIVGPSGEPAANTVVPLYGWTDIDASGVGASVPGDAASTEPTEPGVALLESRMGDQVPNILLRLGSIANRRGETRFDGAFTVLRVTEVDETGFRGLWSSGVGMDRAQGPFCAWMR